MALIRIESLHKHFRMGGEDIRALDGVSFEVQAGEQLAIAGPSGCGKSTLMNILGLLDTPGAGRYLFDGRDVGAFSDDERSRLRNQTIGFVFQTFNLLPRLSALRNVEMPLVYSASFDRRYTREHIRERAVEALTRVGLADRMDHAPNELSGGQRQRTAIARALVNDPKLILADEPTGNLDSKSGVEILSLFDKLNGEGVTLLIVTHDPQVASAARRTIRMLDGKIVEDTRRKA